MHELSLATQVPADRQTQILHLLSGLTASRPVSIKESHLVFAPSRDLATLQRAIDNSKVGSQPKILKAGDAHLVQLVQSSSGDTVQNVQQGEEGARWTMQLLELPEPAVKTHSMRLASYSEIVVPGKTGPGVYMASLGFKQITAYTIEGDRFVSNNIVLLLHRVMTSSPGEAVLKPLDPQNSYILSATIRIADGSKPSLVKVAQQELDALKTRLKGVVDLRAPDRLSMDTRAR